MLHYAKWKQAYLPTMELFMQEERG